MDTPIPAPPQQHCRCHLCRPDFFEALHVALGSVLQTPTYLQLSIYSREKAYRMFIVGFETAWRGLTGEVRTDEDRATLQQLATAKFPNS
jgi:hypothetical protein